MNISPDVTFCAAMRYEAEKHEVGILIVGGQSGAGKSHLINYLLQYLNRRQVVVWDLAHIRRQILSYQPAAKKQLYDLFGCSNVPIRKHFSVELCRRIYGSAGALLTYYSWLEAVCRPVIMEGWQNHREEKRWWILELVSPIDMAWQIADLHIRIMPPAWLVERRLMKRAGITRFAAMNLRRLQEEAIQLNATSDVPYTPDLVFSNSGKSEAEDVLHVLEETENAYSCVRT